MGRRRALLWFTLFVALGAAGAAGLWGGDGGDDAVGAREGRVTRVVDGDTVEVVLGGRREKVRYIGVDTPETRRPGTPIECFGRAASAYNSRLVGGERVRLRFDADRRDRYGRLLAYVYRRRDGLWVNGALVRAGYATTLAIAPNLAHAADLRALERRARRLRRGLWGACP